MVSSHFTCPSRATSSGSRTTDSTTQLLFVNNYWRQGRSVCETDVLSPVPLVLSGRSLQVAARHRPAGYVCPSLAATPDFPHRRIYVSPWRTSSGVCSRMLTGPEQVWVFRCLAREKPAVVPSGPRPSPRGEAGREVGVAPGCACANVDQ